MSNPAKIEKANMVQLSTAFGTIYDKRRLEEGKSTENVNIQQLTEMYLSYRDDKNKDQNP